MYKHLLVAINGSEQSYNALDHAVSIAEKFGSELTLLTVVPKMNAFSPGDYHGASITIYIDLEQSHEKLKVFYQKALTNAVARVRSEHPDINVSTILMEDCPPTTIVDVAEKVGCDMIVMGSRGIGGITGWVLGSTSHRVAVSCNKPIIIIK